MRRISVPYITIVALLALGVVPREPLFTLMGGYRTGVLFVNRIEEDDEHNVLEYEYMYNGGGVAIGDVSGDGLPDLYFTANMGDNALYVNQGDFRFSDMTAMARVAGEGGWNTGVTMADVNADGLLDIYVCRSGSGEPEERTNLLYINRGNLTFSEQAEDFGLADPSYSTQASFFDYDNDGDLDVFLVNHSIKRYQRFDVAWIRRQRDPYAGDKLYRNDDGRFVDISEEAGIIGNPIGFGLSASIDDVNGDGWLDIYVTNDYVEDDYLYINQQNGTFKEDIRGWMGHTSVTSMGSDVADVNNDLLPDFFVLDMLPEDNRRQKLLKGPEPWNVYRMQMQSGYHHQYMHNTLQLNNGDGTFSEIARLAGISNTDWSWSALLADFDSDGFKDLFVSNGYLRDYTNMDFLRFRAPAFFDEAKSRGGRSSLYELVHQMPSTNIANYVFRNEHDLTFSNRTSDWGLDQKIMSNGAAYGDIDADGDLDLVINNVNREAFLYRNNAVQEGASFLRVQLVGQEHNRLGTGARVTVTTPDGKRQVQRLMSSRGFQSAVEPILVFGLGNQRTADVAVEWPTGRHQEVTGGPVNRTVTLSYSDAIPGWLPSPPETSMPLFAALPGAQGIDFLHEEDPFVDFDRERLLPHMLSHEGPALAVGDINRDGLQDLYLGGASGQAGRLYIQSIKATFRSTDVAAFDDHAEFEDVDATFFDADGDGDLDLYVVSGGNQEAADAGRYQDRLYLNGGFGGFSYDADALPEIDASGSVVAPHDVDGDGDTDLFVGGRVQPGSYPVAPRSYFLLNQDGRFTDATDVIAPDLGHVGMVTDAAWGDVDGDGRAELVVAGEWMPIRIFQPDETRLALSDVTETAGLTDLTGWWNCVQLSDLDADGDLDIVAGNRGLNGQIKASRKEPARLYATDLDNNGTVDPILTYYVQGVSYPVASRDELLDQINSLEDTFPSYESYSTATLEDIVPADRMASTLRLQVTEFASVVLENEGGGAFHPHRLPVEAQIAPIRDIVVADFNQDGRKDLLLAGNDFGNRVEEGRFDAGRGLVLLSSGPLTFTAVRSRESGFLAPWDVRELRLVDTRLGTLVVVANNNDGVAAFGVLTPG